MQIIKEEDVVAFYHVKEKNAPSIVYRFESNLYDTVLGGSYLAYLRQV